MQCLSHTMGFRPILCVFHTVTIDSMITEKLCIINSLIKRAEKHHVQTVLYQVDGGLFTSYKCKTFQMPILDHY